MRPGPIGGPIFTGIRIDANKNKQCKYLYNKVSDLMRKEKVGGTFRPYDIKIDSEKPSIIDKLKEWGIKFIKDSDDKQL